MKTAREKEEKTPLTINADHNDTHELLAGRTGDLHILSFGHGAVESFCLENVRRLQIGRIVCKLASRLPWTPGEL